MPMRSALPSCKISSASCGVEILPTAMTGVWQPCAVRYFLTPSSEIEIVRVRVIVARHAAVAAKTGVRIKRFAGLMNRVLEFAAPPTG